MPHGAWPIRRLQSPTSTSRLSSSWGAPAPTPFPFPHDYLFQFRMPLTATATTTTTTTTTTIQPVLESRIDSLELSKLRWPASTDTGRLVRATNLPLYLRNPLAHPGLPLSNATSPRQFLRLRPIPHVHPPSRRSLDEARRLQHTPRLPHHEPAPTSGTSLQMRPSARRA